MTIRVLDPRLDPEREPLALAPALASLDGATIGLLDNTKIGTARLYDHLEALIRRRGVREVIRRRKPDLSRPAPPRSPFPTSHGRPSHQHQHTEDHNIIIVHDGFTLSNSAVVDGFMPQAIPPHGTAHLTLRGVVYLVADQAVAPKGTTTDSMNSNSR